MKKIVIVTLLIFTIGLVYAQTSFTTLQENHKKEMQKFGNILLERNANFSFGVAGKDVISIAKSNNKISFYTEKGNKKLYTVLSLVSNRSNEIVFVFDNKVTILNNTYSIKYKIVFNFSGKLGFKILVSQDLRWDIWKCVECIECAGDNIDDLYKAYKECGLNWECWLNKYKLLINLYDCVKNKCLSCFAK